MYRYGSLHTSLFLLLFMLFKYWVLLSLSQEGIVNIRFAFFFSLYCRPSTIFEKLCFYSILIGTIHIWILNGIEVEAGGFIPLQHTQTKIPLKDDRIRETCRHCKGNYYEIYECMHDKRNRRIYKLQVFKLDSKTTKKKSERWYSKKTCYA